MALSATLSSSANKLWVAFVQTLFKVNVNTWVSDGLPRGMQSPCITHSKFNTRSCASLKLSSDQKYRETPRKSFLNANSRLCWGCPLLLFGFLFIRHFQGATFLLFSFLHFMKSFVRCCFARCTTCILKIVSKGFDLAIQKHCQDAVLLSLHPQRVLAQWLESPPTQGQQISS